jgi:hypothetical protein
MRFHEFLHDPPVEQMNLAIGVSGKPRIVGHHADGGALAVQLAEQVHHGLPVFGIKVTGGFVGQ